MSDRGKASFTTMDFSDGVMKNVEENNIHTPEVGNILNKGFEDLDDSLVIKSVRDHVARTIFSTAAGGAIGAANSDPDKRKEGALRGAAIGGVAGTAVGLGVSGAQKIGEKALKNKAAKRAEDLVKAKTRAWQASQEASQHALTGNKSTSRMAAQEAGKNAKEAISAKKDLRKYAKISPYMRDYTIPYAASGGAAGAGGYFGASRGKKEENNTEVKELRSSLVVKDTSSTPPAKDSPYKHSFEYGAEKIAEHMGIPIEQARKVRASQYRKHGVEPNKLKGEPPKKGADESTIVVKGKGTALKVGAGIAGGALVGGLAGHAVGKDKGKKQGRKEGATVGYTYGMNHGYNQGLIDSREHSRGEEKYNLARKLSEEGKIPRISVGSRGVDYEEPEAKSIDESLVVEKDFFGNVGRVAARGMRRAGEFMGGSTRLGKINNMRSIGAEHPKLSLSASGVGVGSSGVKPLPEQLSTDALRTTRKWDVPGMGQQLVDAGMKYGKIANRGKLGKVVTGVGLAGTGALGYKLASDNAPQNNYVQRGMTEEEMIEKGLLEFEKSPILNTAKRLIASNKARTTIPVPLDESLTAGLDKVSRYNRLQTAARRNGQLAGPAAGTIMAQRQAAGKHLTDLRDNANYYRGARVPGKKMPVTNYVERMNKLGVPKNIYQPDVNKGLNVAAILDDAVPYAFRRYVASNSSSSNKSLPDVQDKKNKKPVK